MKHSKLKDLLDETSVAGGVGGFVGSKGQGVDKLFAGGFKPDEGLLKDLLKQQLENELEMRKYTDILTPEMDRDFKLIDVEWDKDLDDTPNKDDATKRLTFKNTSNKFMAITNEIEYDLIEDEDYDRLEDEIDDWKYIYKQKRNQENDDV